MTTRRRRAVITEDTEVTVRTTRQVAVEDTITATEPLSPAPGWAAVPQLTGPDLRAQRTLQVRRAAEFLLIRAGDYNTAETVRCASRILRAGPGASLAESVHGRYT